MLTNILKLNSNLSQICRNSYRLMASTQSQPSDPIQKLFVEKIREYDQKSRSTADGLVDADDKVLKGLQEEMERVARSHQIKDEKTIASLNLKFDATVKLDPINMTKD